MSGRFVVTENILRLGERLTDFILNAIRARAILQLHRERSSSRYLQERRDVLLHSGIRRVSTPPHILLQFVLTDRCPFSSCAFRGHEVPAYKYGSLSAGEAALQMFSQIMSGQGLSST